VLINCGGDAYLDTQDRKWSADTYYTGGETYSKTSADILDTDDDEIFHSERFGMFEYNIPMPRGTYEVILHFAELEFNKPGQRLFSVDIEGTVLSDIDIVQQAGGFGNKAIKREAAVPVADGFLTLLFLPGDTTNPNAKVS
jgi:Malectin domain